MIRPLRWVPIGLGLLAIFGCDFRWQKLSSQVVIRVNDSGLTAREFSEQLARHLKDYDALAAKDPEQIKRAKDLVSQNFIMQSLVLDFAKANKISVTEEEIEGEIKKTREQYPDDLSFRRVLAQENLSISEWREQVRKSLYDQKIFNQLAEKIPKIEVEELKKYYAENKSRFQKKERIYLRQIVVDDLTKAKALADEMKKADFVAMAQKYSVSPEAKSGGLVGWVEKGSVDIFDKAFALPIGTISPILESAYGFHFFKVERKAAQGVASFEEVRKEIERVLRAQKEQALYLTWLDNRIRASRVYKNNELIQTISVETRSAR